MRSRMSQAVLGGLVASSATNHGGAGEGLMFQGAGAMPTDIVNNNPIKTSSFSSSSSSQHSVFDPPMTSSLTPDYTTSEAGNPFVSGWYADPDTGFYDGLYWVFPTSSLPYEEQTYLDAFSSPDLVRWTKHPRVLTTDDVSWAHKALWAPSPISRNGKYYLYFAANDIQVKEIANGLVGGIGVAVADRPQGPYKDALGKPLIGDFHNGAQPIDQDVFIDGDGDDDSGQAYMFYGGHSHANVVKLNDDMISLGTFSETQRQQDRSGGTTTTTTTKEDVFREITPANYTEGSQMFKRKGVYYYMWSEGDWTGPNYAVSYGMSRTSPLGPFTDGGGRILEQDDAVARGGGHNGVINVPGTDIWYMVYHRRPLSETDGNHRVVCYDRMYFDDEAGGAILPVEMKVKDNFKDGEMVAWSTFGVDDGGHGDGDGRRGWGKWEVVDERLAGSSSPSPLHRSPTMAMLDTNFSAVVYEASIMLPPVPEHENNDENSSSSDRNDDAAGNDKTPGYNAQLVFRAQGNTREGYSEWLAVVFHSSGSPSSSSSSSSRLAAVQLVSYCDGNVTVLAEPDDDTRDKNGGSDGLVPGKEYFVRIKAVGGHIEVCIYGDEEASNDAVLDVQALLSLRPLLVLEAKGVPPHLLTAGANGVAVAGRVSGVRFGNISVAHATE